MLVIALGLASLAVFVRLAEAARRGSDSARTAAVIEAAILIALASLGVVLAAALLDLNATKAATRTCRRKSAPASGGTRSTHGNGAPNSALR